MIKVARVTAPKDFDTKVKTPGMKFLKPFLDARKKPKSKDWNNKDFWNRVKPELREAFGARCAYLAMREMGDGEVDHFESKSNKPEKAYDWTNYRFANNEVNKKKSSKTAVLDPYLVDDNWFRVDLVSGTVFATDKVPDKYKKLAENTITKLGLNKKSYRETRLNYSQGCLMNPPSKAHLVLISDLAPLVADAIRDFWAR